MLTACWLRFLYFWKNSPSLIESTWFTAKLGRSGHLTDVLNDSGGKRDALCVLLSSDFHHPLPRSQEKLLGLGLTLRGAGQALELALSRILSFC